jgi:UDP-N-acetylmuramoyl-L-alanyl-D-glutamate--2,6-diaminopimelate ligase
MKLGELLSGAPKALASREITRVTQDSREAGPETLFFAIEGVTRDGHGFVADVLARGNAPAAVVRRGHPKVAALAADGALAPRLIEVDDPRVALGETASRFYDEPSSHMLVCGITGTNGKTTSTYLLEAILEEWGRKPAVIGTVENRFERHRFPSTHTTPDGVTLQRMLAEFRKLGADAIAMEVSSHALEQRRVAGMKFAAALFTNLTQDHLDYHGTLEAYFDSKTLLFTDYPVGARAVHADDPYGQQLIEICERREFDVITFGRANCSVNYGALRISAAGIEGELTLDHPGAPERLAIRSPLLGAFNAQNISGAVAVALGLGIPPAKIASALTRASQVPGRMESVPNAKGLTVVVDYAHTPDALEKALATLRPLAKGRLLCVFGCGGDRDPAKRPIMAAAAERLADAVIATSDNPRTEDPERILDDVFRGFRDPAKPARVTDRRAAIARAIGLLSPGDVLLIAGKGHEDYQIVGERKLPFDDRLVAAEYLR